MCATARASSALDASGDGGAAVADFVLVSALVTLLFLAVFQVGLALHIRNTLIACASEGARYGARADREPGDGVARAQQLIRASLADRYADDVRPTPRPPEGVAWCGAGARPRCRCWGRWAPTACSRCGHAPSRRTNEVDRGLCRRGSGCGSWAFGAAGERLLARVGWKAPAERGSAVVEFVFLAVLLMVPLFYLVMVLARLQAGAYAVSGAAREAGRAYTTARVPAQAPARAEAAAESPSATRGFDGWARSASPATAIPASDRTGGWW